MAVTKTFSAVPFSKSSKVERWDFSAKYENDSEGDGTYYTATFSTTIEATNPQGGTAFTKKAKGSWSKSEIEALMPISHWDTVFASQVASVITSPVTKPTPDTGFTIPS
jgi:hypothetical protein